VDSVDINYDSISHSLTVLGYWSQSPTNGWTDKIRKHAAGTDQVEVGLLGAEKATEPEEIKMGGLLGVVGKDDTLSMFNNWFTGTFALRMNMLLILLQSRHFSLSHLAITTFQMTQRIRFRLLL
jgi:hypothetical protein